MIGGSDVPAILGLPHPVSGKPKDVWPTYERVTGLRPWYDDNGDTKAARRGRGMEAALLAWFQMDHPEERVVPNDQSFTAGGWMSGKPDGLRGPPGVGLQPITGILEAKTDRELNREFWGPPPHGAPAFHESQVRWYMALCDVDDGALVVYHPMSETYLEYEIQRDARIERALIAKVREWYERFVLGAELPPFTDRAAKTMARMYRADGRKERRATGTELDMLSKLHQNKLIINAYEGQNAQMRGRLMERMRDVTDLVHPETGRRLVRWRPQKGAGRIDVARIRQERPDIVEQFTKPSAETRPFNLEKP